MPASSASCAQWQGLARPGRTLGGHTLQGGCPGGVYALVLFLLHPSRDKDQNPHSPSLVLSPSPPHPDALLRAEEGIKGETESPAVIGHTLKRATKFEKLAFSNQQRRGDCCTNASYYPRSGYVSGTEHLIFCTRFVSPRGHGAPGGQSLQASERSAGRLWKWPPRQPLLSASLSFGGVERCDSQCSKGISAKSFIIHTLCSKVAFQRLLHASPHQPLGHALLCLMRGS